MNKAVKSGGHGRYYLELRREEGQDFSTISAGLSRQQDKT